MANQLFTNVTIFDASGRAPFPGEVLIQGNRIKKVAEGAGRSRTRRRATSSTATA